MRPQSAKAKGRRACAELKEKLLGVLPVQPDDIKVASSGCTGEDILLSPHARSILPFVLEVKNQESMNIWDAYAQAEKHWDRTARKEDVYPAVVYRRNRSELMISMSVEDFLHFCFQRKSHVSIQKKEEEHSGIHIP